MAENSQKKNWRGSHHDNNIISIKKGGRMGRGVSLMTHNHKKNVKDFSEKKIIAHSWLI